MSCLHKYWVREFIKFFLIIQLVILVLFVSIDYLSRMDKFLNSDISLFGALGYVLLKVPFMFVQLTPAGILLSAITVFGLMNKNNELLAIKSSGISIYCLVKPAILAGAILAFIMFFLGETIIPVSMARSNYIKYHVIKKRNNIYSSRKDIWIKSENRLIHINFFNPALKSVAGITITTLDRNFVLKSRIDAGKGYYKQDRWILEDIIEQVREKDSKEYDIKKYDKKSVSLAFKPEDLGEISRLSEEMSFAQLRNYVRKVEEEGYDATTYKVDMNAKIAFPFICIIMALIGAATGIRPFAKDNIPLAIAVGIVISFMYWIMYGFCLSLGYGMVLPPVISAWAANLFFLCSGILYLVHTE